MQNPPGEQRRQSSTVGELILANAISSTDRQLVCTLAKVCKDLNMAVQHQTPAGRLHVSLHKGLNGWHPWGNTGPSNSMEKISSFSKLMTKHARLVSRLEVTGQLPHNNADRAWFSTLITPLFSLALQSAALATTAKAAQHVPLGLQSYSSDIFHDSTVLQALPATSLTHLQLAGSSTAAVAAALPRLSNLQQLDIAGGAGTTRHSSIWAAAGQVSTLTCMNLGWVTAEDVTQLPVQLERLELRLLDSGPVDFSHLTRLSSLNISASANNPSLGQLLPAGLVELNIAGNAGVSDDPSIFRQFNISQLQSLRSLSICDSRESREDLRQLGGLPALCNLSLGYTNAPTAYAASWAWAELVQLKGIELSYDCSRLDLMFLLYSLRSSTQLTWLAMFIDIDRRTDQGERINGVCDWVSSLHQLQALTIRISDGSRAKLAWDQGDFNHLSTLTKLTKLDLSMVGFAREDIDDLTVIKLFMKLKQLQELRVPAKGLAVFPLIGDLSNLRTLELYNVPAEVQQAGLQELQGLKRLTELRGFDSCSKKALADFWNAVRS